MVDRKTAKKVLIWTAGLLVLFVLYCVGLSVNPPGFYVDESGIGYNAYLLSRTGAGEFGPYFPIFFQFFSAGYTQWVSPSQVYLLALVFLVAPPTVLVTRIFSAFWVFSACLLIGLLAKRISGKTSIGVIVAASALLTPWFFEVRGVVMEPHFIPMALVLFLYIAYQAQTLEKWTWRQPVTFAASLALLTYSYSSGRMLAPMMAAGLVFFLTRQRLKYVLLTWVLYGVTLLPIVIFNWLHPGALTSRFWAATYLRPDMPWITAAFEFVKRYFEDVSPQCLLDKGDVVMRHHIPGFYGPFFYSIFFLAAIGLVIVVARRLQRPWWRFALYGLAIAPIPGALTYEPCHAMRQLALPVFLVIMTIPALQWFLAKGGGQSDQDEAETGPEERRPVSLSKRLASLKPIILAVILSVTAVEAVRFQYYYRREGRNRHIYFDAGYKEAFDVAVAQPMRPIYLVDGDYGPTYITGLWFAVQEGYPLSEFVHVPPGTRPPGDSLVLSSERQCSNCQVIERKGAFSVYLSDPQPEAATIPETTAPVFGGGQGSASGDLAKPRGIAADSKGNIYVADTGNRRIQKFSENGELLLSIDGGQAGGGELREPLGITVDAAGNIYVTDGTTNRLTKFGPDGKFVNEWAGPDPGFYGPRDVVAVGSYVFVLDQGHSRVVRLDTKTDTFHQWGSSGSGEGQFNELTGIAASDDRIFVADARNDRVQVFDLDGGFVRQWPVSQWQAYIWHYPDAVFDKGSKRLYVTSGWSNEVLVFNEDGTPIESLGSSPSATLNRPSAIAISKASGGKKLFVLNTGDMFAEPAQSSIAVIDLPADTPSEKKPSKK
jgi:DNA-binding beta-propeller fold protein YncE